MNTLMKKNINGYDVVWAADGYVYFNRDFHDCLPEYLQGTPFMCKTIKEFENVYNHLKAALN